MGSSNYHAHIMLDLECCAVEAPNPVLIELGAVHFDPDTGTEFKSLKTPINHQSCLDRGLVSDESTTAWVEQNIPETLATSKTTSITLENALFKFSQFIRTAVAATKKTLRESGRDPELCQPLIWGNGVIADNVWIKNAYLACDMIRPWKFTGDMCVRTVVKYTAAITGRDYSREVVRKGKHHDALDDCRHQVKYLVLARNSLVPKPKKIAAEKGTPATPTLEKSSSSGLSTPATKLGTATAFFSNNRLETMVSSGSTSAGNVTTYKTPASSTSQAYFSKTTLPTPDTSFSEEKQALDEIPDHSKEVSESQSKRRHGPPTNAAVQRPGMLPTPDTSFTSVSREIEDIAGLAPKTSGESTEQSFSTKVGEAMKSKGLLSPNTSFSVPNDDDDDSSDAFEPPSPTPLAKGVRKEAKVDKEDEDQVATQPNVEVLPQAG